MLLRELSRLYTARRRGEVPSLPGLQFQYADYAVWQRKTVRPGAPSYEATLAWWKREFSDSVPATDLPFRRPRSVKRAIQKLLRKLGLHGHTPPPDPGHGIVRWVVEPDLTERLEHLASAEGATFHMIRLAAFAALLADETGAQDVTFASYVSTRNRLSLQAIFGLFVNIVILRLRCNPAMTFHAWLAVVRAKTMDVEAHCSIPYEELRHALRRDGVRLPEARVVFNVGRYHHVITFAGLELSWAGQQFQKLPSAFVMNPNRYNEHSYCRALFDPDLYDSVAARAFVERYKRLLEAASRFPHRSLTELLAISKPSMP
jgi:hypothetical protein